jgi:hypothetical protein
MMHKLTPSQVFAGIPWLMYSIIACLLISFCGCGVTRAAVGNSPPFTPTGTPDRVSISIDAVNQAPSVVTLHTASLILHLYTTIYSLPPMPAQQACTADLGPHYTLTFSQGESTLVQFLAERDGCHPIAIVNSNQARQTTTDFWNQLDQAIIVALPIANVAWAAVKHQISGDLPPQTGRLAAAQVAQRLYQAMVALPVVTTDALTATDPITYEVIFHTADQVIPALISQQRHLISLAGDFHSRTGTYALNADFQQLLNGILADVSFAPATPDDAMLTVTTAQTSSQTHVTNTRAFQQIYQRLLALPTIAPPANCPSEADKEAGNGSWYHLTFTQWDIPILTIDAFAGNCMAINSGWTDTIVADRYLQGNQEFWNLLRAIAG